MTTSLNLLPTKRSKTSNDIGPQYYKRGKIQVWDFIADQELDFFSGNVIKYVCRAGHKEDELTDLKKAKAYIDKRIELLS